MHAYVHSLVFLVQELLHEIGLPMSVVILVTRVCDERAGNLKEFESLEGYEFEIAMDKVRSALKIFGGPYILGSKTTAYSLILRVQRACV